MNTSQTLDNKKQKLVDNDFKKTVVDASGKIPKDPILLDGWYRKVFKIWNKWLYRYEGHPMEIYAKNILFKYVDNVEAQYKVISLTAKKQAI